ncbi:MAG: hypothetical protein AAB853_02175, partial [Patescibacteria group bacterium]
MKTFNHSLRCHPYAEGRLLFYEGGEKMENVAAGEKSDRGKTWELLRKEMDDLSDDYRAYEKEYKNLQEPADIARFLLFPKEELAFASMQERANRLRQECPLAQNIRTDTADVLRQDLEALVSRESLTGSKLIQLEERESELQKALDLNNPDIKRMIDALEPPTKSKLESLKRMVQSKVTPSNNPKGSVKVLELRNAVLETWPRSDEERTLQIVLQSFPADVADEFRRWIVPQLSPQQLRQWDLAERAGKIPHEEVIALAYIAERCLAHLSEDALAKLAEMPPGAGVEKVCLKALESFSVSLRQRKKDAMAQHV